MNWKTILLATIGVLAILSGIQVLRSPNTVLDDILVAKDGSRIVVQVKFNIPIRYVDHFPTRRGQVIQIKVRPVSLSNTQKNEYLGSESILPGFLEQVPITDVAYEGDVAGGPLLTVRFREPVIFDVREESDFTGIDIVINKN